MTYSLISLLAYWLNLMVEEKYYIYNMGFEDEAAEPEEEDDDLEDDDESDEEDEDEDKEDEKGEEGFGN